MHSLPWLGSPSSCQVVFWPKLWNQKLLDERHWTYTHAVFRMEWPQPLTCGAPYSTNMKHSLLLHPKEKEVDAWHVAISFSDLFFLSAIPFWCGVYGTECSIWIPSYSQKLWKYPLMYSPPLSYVIDLIFLLKLFSMLDLKILKVSKTSDFCFMK